MLSRLKQRFSGTASPAPTPAPVPPAHGAKYDWMIGGMFVSAIALLLLVAGYVISRISSDTAYRKKWEEYDDCGWA